MTCDVAHLRVNAGVHADVRVRVRAGAGVCAGARVEGYRLED